jgi:hypothetical protein
MTLLRRCLESLKKYVHLHGGVQKSLVALPLVIFSVSPLVKKLIFYPRAKLKGFTFYSVVVVVVVLVRIAISQIKAF